MPDSGIDAAIGYARESGCHTVCFIKNRYIGRTLLSRAVSRRNLVRIKLNPIASVVRGKRVVMIDDSIVRGTTVARIVKLLRDAGATQVHMRVSSPPFLNPCYYGTDIDSREHLIAGKNTIEEIARIVDVDSLGYLALEDLPKLLGYERPEGYCSACFDAVYPTSIPSETDKGRFERKISEMREKMKSHSESYAAAASISLPDTELSS